MSGDTEAPLGGGDGMRGADETDGTEHAGSVSGAGTAGGSAGLGGAGAVATPAGTTSEARPIGWRAPEPLPASRLLAGIATLDSGYFAAVMATGIVSIAARLVGFAPVADGLLWVTIALFVLLVMLNLVRVVRYPRRFTNSLLNPTSLVAYFTVVAGCNVLATALGTWGLWQLRLALAAVAFLVWLVLTYGLFCMVVLAGNRPRLRDITGVWLVWVVGTQSVSVIAAALAPAAPVNWFGDVLAATSVLFWCVGCVLYFILVVIIFLRLFLIETTPAEMGPAYWILMGATAISVRAAAGILDVGVDVPNSLLQATAPFVMGLATLMWAFGSWFIPMLVLFGLWRYFVRGYSWSYEPKLWSVVFPLGMYTVASITLGHAIGWDFMVVLAQVWVYLAFAGWAIVALLAVVFFARGPRPIMR